MTHLVTIVIQSQPAQETIAHGNLTAAGFDAYLPTVVFEGRTGRLREKRYTVVEPLFPGYLFVTLDLSDSSWRAMLAMRGVKRILGADSEHPTPVPVGAIDDLKARYAAGEFTKRVGGLRVAAGDPVTVGGGAFDGHAGVCTVSRGERVRVLLRLLGGAVEVDLPLAMVAGVGA